MLGQLDPGASKMNEIASYDCVIAPSARSTSPHAPDFAHYPCSAQSLASPSIMPGQSSIRSGIRTIPHARFHGDNVGRMSLSSSCVLSHRPISVALEFLPPSRSSNKHWSHVRPSRASATRYRFKTVSCGGRNRLNITRLPVPPRLFHHSRLPPATRPLPLHDFSIIHDYLLLHDSASDLATGIAPTASGHKLAVVQPQLSYSIVITTLVHSMQRLVAMENGVWTDPGGRIAKGESLDAAAAKILLKETGLELSQLVEIGAKRIGSVYQKWSRADVQVYQVPDIPRSRGGVSFVLNLR
eukprot:COSAG02_NODE_1263_length_13548_cov_13.881627_2_plen_298_part_00